MENPQNKFVVPNKKFAPTDSVESLKRINQEQNNLNNNVGGSSITVPEFNSPFPGGPNDATHASKMGNITNSLAISNSVYDKHAFEGGKKSKKLKSKKSKKSKKLKSKKSKKLKSKKLKSKKSKNSKKSKKH